jgi:hypothetical protein
MVFLLHGLPTDYWIAGICNPIISRVSTDEQDLRAVAALGVGTDRLYVDKGLTGIS